MTAMSHADTAVSTLLIIRHYLFQRTALHVSMSSYKGNRDGTYLAFFGFSDGWAKQGGWVAFAGKEEERRK